MSFRPRIARPCPVADRLDTVLGGSLCRRCDKIVHDLDALSPGERFALLAGASGEICVRFRAPALLAAAALATVASPLAAQETPTSAAAIAGNPADEIIVGGARRLTASERAQLRREMRVEARQTKRAERTAEAEHHAANDEPR